MKSVGKRRKCWKPAFSPFPTIFSSPEHEVLRVSFCDHSPSVGIRRRAVCVAIRTYEPDIVGLGLS